MDSTNHSDSRSTILPCDAHTTCCDAYSKLKEEYLKLQEENSKLWKSLRNVGVMKSRSNSAASNGSPQKLTSSRFRAETPPPLISTAAYLSHSPLSTYTGTSSSENLLHPPAIPSGLNIDLESNPSSNSGMLDGIFEGFATSQHNNNKVKSGSVPDFLGQFPIHSPLSVTEFGQGLTQLPPLPEPLNTPYSSPVKHRPPSTKRNSLGLGLNFTRESLPSLPITSSPSLSEPPLINISTRPSLDSSRPPINSSGSTDSIRTTSVSHHQSNLTPILLQHAKIHVTGSNISGKKEIVYVEIEILLENGETVPGVLKNYKDLLELDSSMKMVKSISRKVSIPDKSLFKDNSSQRVVEQRNIAVKTYLVSLLESSEGVGHLIDFLNSGIVNRSSAAADFKDGSGWLTKRGRNLGLSTTRYYVLSQSQNILSYFDGVGGAKLGEFNLSQASIGKQSSKSSTASYRHAFLIRNRPDGHGEVDTILCATSDESRDSWIEAISKSISANGNGKTRNDSAPSISTSGLSSATLSTSYSTPDQSESRGSFSDSPTETRSQIISGPSNAVPISEDFKKDKERKKASFWVGFGKKEEKSPILPPTPLSFGISLNAANAASSLHNLPSLVYRCVQFLDTNCAANEEGIYRLSGSSAVIRTLKDRFNAEGDIDLLRSVQFLDIHAVAGLLKLWLRELPTNILSRELQNDFVGLLELEPALKMERLDYQLSRLPQENYVLIDYLFTHLAKISDNESINKMGIRNLAIVLSPSLSVPAPLFTLILSKYTTELPASTSPSSDLLFKLRLDPSPATSQEVFLPLRSPGLPSSPRDLSPSSPSTEQSIIL